MRRITQWITRTGISMALVGLLGCGKAVHPVQGTLKFEGKPLAGGGAIVFLPLDSQSEMVANGEIAPDGTYRLTTHRPGDGANAGEYRVVILQTTEKEPQRTPDGTAPAKRESSVPEAERIPAIYADHYQSPLRAHVEAKPMNEIDLDLKRQ